MPATFPWPVTDDELLLTNALEEVLVVYEPKGENEAAWVAEVASKLIVEACELGVRDPACGSMPCS